MSVVPQTDINDYANGLVLDFLDAFHEQLRRDLEEAFFGRRGAGARVSAVSRFVPRVGLFH